MKLSGRRILVLVAEHRAARAIQDVLEKAGAAVMLGPYSGSPQFDAMIVDGDWVRRSLVKTLFDAGTPIIAYTGNAAAFQNRFPGTPVISKPAADAHFLSAVDMLFNTQRLGPLKRIE